MEQKRKLCMIFCIIFGLEVIASAYTFVINTFGLYNEIVSELFWIAINAVRVGTLWYAFRNINVYSNKLGRYSALGLALLNAVYLINNITSMSMDVNIFIGLGAYSSVFLAIIYVALTLLFIWFTRSWAAIKICTTGACLFTMIQSFGWPKVQNLFELYDKTQDYELMEKAISMANTFENLSHVATMFYIAAFVCTVVWLNKREKSISVKNSPIELI